jgi:hypothetical protein
MKKFFLFLMIIAFCETGCLKKSTNDTNDPDTVGYFMANLRADMDYAQIVNVFGEPDTDIGSGIHIYVYNMTDGSEVWIGYTNQIMYARHMSSDGQLMHVII